MKRTMIGNKLSESLKLMHVFLKGSHQYVSHSQSAGWAGLAQAEL